MKTFVSGGVAMEAPFGRKDDLVAIGVAWSDPSPDSGFRAETLLELLYRVEIAKAILVTPDLALVRRIFLRQRRNAQHDEEYDAKGE